LLEDKGALLEITENIIRKNLFFKHDEEFSKEAKDSGKDAAGKKKRGKDKVVDSKDEPKEDQKEMEAPKEEVKDTKMKKSGSQEVLKPEGDTDLVKPKLTQKVSDNPVIKKSDIAFKSFKNCSGVRLNQFLTQMKFIESKARQIFVEACSNLCEIECTKEYDLEMNVKSEYKIIKLKDSVLKDYIAKTTKESTLIGKSNQSKQKHDVLNEPMHKSGAQTARSKGSSAEKLHGSKKDTFLGSSLYNTQNFFPKTNRNVIPAILDKIVDKF
jgi:hypothetical protein